MYVMSVVTGILYLYHEALAPMVACHSRCPLLIFQFLSCAGLVMAGPAAC